MKDGRKEVPVRKRGRGGGGAGREGGWFCAAELARGRPSGRGTERAS